MFTGIVEEVGRVRYLRGPELAIACRRVLEGTNPGDSLNVSGACLTVTHLDPEGFTAEVIPETRRRTNLGTLRPGDPVNLERALPLGGRVGGHLVQGHVDAVGRVLSLGRQGGEVTARIQFSPALGRYIVEKGFIAVDGVSLTVVEAKGSFFTVALVRYTMENTNLGARRPGDKVNLEVDIMAKYAEKQGAPAGLSRLLVRRAS